MIQIAYFELHFSNPVSTYLLTLVQKVKSNYTQDNNNTINKFLIPNDCNHFNLSSADKVTNRKPLSKYLIIIIINRLFIRY